MNLSHSISDKNRKKSKGDMMGFFKKEKMTFWDIFCVYTFFFCLNLIILGIVWFVESLVAGHWIQTFTPFSLLLHFIFESIFIYLYGVKKAKSIYDWLILLLNEIGVILFYLILPHSTLREWMTLLLVSSILEPLAVEIRNGVKESKILFDLSKDLKQSTKDTIQDIQNVQKKDKSSSNGEQE